MSIRNASIKHDSPNKSTSLAAVFMLVSVTGIRRRNICTNRRIQLLTRGSRLKQPTDKYLPSTDIGS